MINGGSNKNETKSKMYRTLPSRRREASPWRYSISMINCLTTKSEEFVFD